MPLRHYGSKPRGTKGTRITPYLPKNNIIYCIYIIELSSAIATESIFSFGVIPEFQKEVGFVLPRACAYA